MLMSVFWLIPSQCCQIRTGCPGAFEFQINSGSYFSICMSHAVFGKHILKNDSSFIWNSEVTGYPAFLSAKSDSSIWSAAPYPGVFRDTGEIGPLLPPSGVTFIRQLSPSSVSCHLHQCCCSCLISISWALYQDSLSMVLLSHAMVWSP